MTTLYLIRHGQASFGAEDYDQLSELGRRQSALLGEHLRRTQPPLDAVYSGNLRRQADTAGHAGIPADPSGLSRLAALDEYDYVGIIRAYLPAFMAQGMEARGLTERDILTQPKLFEVAFRFMVRAWMNHEPHDEAPFETWRDFSNRVAEGLATMRDTHGSGARIGIFTSGGVIAAAMRQVLGLSNKRTLSIHWTIYNSSVTQLYYGRSGRHEDALVLGFNSIAHLESAGDRQLLTFR